MPILKPCIAFVARCLTETTNMFKLDQKYPTRHAIRILTYFNTALFWVVMFTIPLLQSIYMMTAIMLVQAICYNILASTKFTLPGELVNEKITKFSYQLARVIWTASFFIMGYFSYVLSTIPTK